MTEPTNPPYPQQRTPEQNDSVRRKSLPVAIAGAILGVAGLAWMLLSPVTAFRPPNPYGINCSFCAMLFGTGILFYAKGTSGTGSARLFSFIAIALGLVGPGIFARQLILFNGYSQNLELDNVRAIAVAAKKYAADHNGTFPPDLLTLLDAGLSPETLHSPLEFNRDPAARNSLLANLDSLRKTTPRDQLAATIDALSDYTYLAGDLHFPINDPIGSDILVAVSNGKVLRIQWAMAFADGTARYVDSEEDKDDAVVNASDAARFKLGLKPIAPAKVFQHDEAASQPQ